MFRVTKFVTFPFVAFLAVPISILSIAQMQALAKDRDRELSSWSITYSDGWSKSDLDGLEPQTAVNSVTMRRNNEEYDIFFHYTLCHMCAATDRKTSYFSVDEEKARLIKVLIDEDQIKEALDRSCTLPTAKARLNKVSVRLDPPPAGYAPSAYDILLGCQSPELDEVKANLDAAIRLFSAWMAEHENQ